MAWIEKRDSGYLVRWREGSRVISERAGSHAEARERKATIELEQSRGAYVARDARRRLLGVYAQEIFAASMNLRQSTLYSYRNNWSRWVEPELGTTPIGELDAARIRRAFTAMKEKGAGPATLQKVRMILGKVLNQALAEGLTLGSR